MFSYEMIRNLNDLEILIYNYVVSHTQKVITMTIRELSGQLNVSSTSILRFCKKIGCDGYSEFRYKLKDSIHNQQHQKKTQDITMIQDFFKKVEKNELEGELEKAAKIINTRSSIIFLGLGSSGTLGKYGARYLSNVGVLSLYIDDPFYPIEGRNYEDTIVIVLSVSGEQRTIYKQIKEFKNGKALVLSVTNTKQCTLAKISDMNIAYYMPMNVLPGLYNVTSQIPVVYILESLAHKVQILRQTRSI